MLRLIRSAVLATALPLLPSLAHADEVGPGEAVVSDLGSTHLVAYFVQQGDRCALTVLTEPGLAMREALGMPATLPGRVRLDLSGDEQAVVDSADHPGLVLTCLAGGTRLAIRPITQSAMAVTD